MTIVLYGCELFWQLSCMAMTLWKHLNYSLTIVLYGHSLDVLNFINRTPLLDVFSWKKHSKMQFDNCTGWLWPMISFWQLYCVAVSFFWQLYCMAVSPYYFLTIVLLFALRFFDNFPIWQKYRNPKFSMKYVPMKRAL